MRFLDRKVVDGIRRNLAREDGFEMEGGKEGVEEGVEEGACLRGTEESREKSVLLKAGIKKLG